MRSRPPKGSTRFKRLLLRWFRTCARDLPWRRTRDPYRVLVSEFMLQQTQVRRVAEFYPRFLDRFPTIASLAAARPSQVREAWQGLGYYARARNLHALARSVVQDGGRIPDRPADLERLPGVGRYTAGAVASFAYEKRVPAVDTNVARVLRRAFGAASRTGGRTDGPTVGPAGSPASESCGCPPVRPSVRPSDQSTWSLAQRLLPRRGTTTWEFNQALMDLGATICIARKPKCRACPVRAACRTGRRVRPSSGLPGEPGIRTRGS
jgi:A/G-specific adenine glycosylase